VVIVFGADQGLAGRFNVRILEFVESHLVLPARAGPGETPDGDAGPIHVFAVGERVSALLRSREIAVARDFSVPGSVNGVGAVVRDLVLACTEWREDQGAERFTLFYNDYRGGASYQPVWRALLPLDPEWLEELRTRRWPGPSLPSHRPDWPRFFGSLVQEHLYITLFRALAESVASENASRLSAMESAESRIDERLREIRGRANERRQQVVTEELLEVIAGFQVLEERREAARGNPEN
jgi:F-type H+-transporting ATPase subunit gamma